jgi:hypothetical protein
MKREKKLEKKAAELTQKLPQGTGVWYWLGAKWEPPAVGSICTPFFVEDGLTVCCEVETVPPFNRSRWSVPATHIARVA